MVTCIVGITKSQEKILTIQPHNTFMALVPKRKLTINTSKKLQQNYEQVDVLPAVEFLSISMLYYYLFC